MAAEIVGWVSSLVLVATIAKQVHRQWSAGTSEGVSKYLFLGQIAASTGFTIYSAIVGNIVFIATNAAMLAAALVGLVILFLHRRRESGVASSFPPRRIGARRRRSARLTLRAPIARMPRAGLRRPFRPIRGQS